MILKTIRMGEGAAPPVLLLHGLFGAASNWGRIQRRLAEAGPVLALDLRNHGASPHAADCTYRAMAEDVAETLAAENIQSAAIVGHSMGGKVAMTLARHHPARVTRLVIADIAPVDYPPRYRDIAARMLALKLEPGLTRAAANAAIEDVAPDPAVRAFLLQNLRFTDPPAWRIGLPEIAAGLPDIEGWPAESAPPYPGPALVLRGEHSDYVLPEYRPLFRAMFPAVKFATLRGAGHWLHADAPDAFLETIQAFLGVK